MRPLILRPFMRWAAKPVPAAARVMPPAPEPAPEESVAVRAARAAMQARAASEKAAAATPMRDPAPSRVSYRLQRLWLTPFFRYFARIGLPLLVALLAGLIYFGNDQRMAAISAGITDIRHSIETRPEFMVRLVAIDGASPTVERLIREAFLLELPVSSFDLDLEMMQAEIAELDMIKQVDLRIRPGGVLEIALRERVPAVVWRGRAGLVLLDDEGYHVMPVQSRSARSDLPILAGDGAPDHVEEALRLISTAAPLATRLRGLIRVGQRRWDVALTGGQYILLPENEPIYALQKVIALDHAQDLLARNITIIDMRNPLRPTLRLAPLAAVEMRRIRANELGEPTR